MYAVQIGMDRMIDGFLHSDGVLPAAFDPRCAASCRKLRRQEFDLVHLAPTCHRRFSIRQAVPPGSSEKSSKVRTFLSKFCCHFRDTNRSSSQSTKPNGA